MAMRGGVRLAAAALLASTAMTACANAAEVARWLSEAPRIFGR